MCGDLSPTSANYASGGKIMNIPTALWCSSPPPREWTQNEKQGAQKGPLHPQRVTNNIFRFLFLPSHFNWRPNLAFAKEPFKKKSPFLALKQVQCRVRSFSPRVISSLGILVKGSEGGGNGLNYGWAPTSELPIKRRNIWWSMWQVCGPKSELICRNGYFCSSRCIFCHNHSRAPNDEFPLCSSFSHSFVSLLHITHLNCLISTPILQSETE